MTRGFIIRVREKSITEEIIKTAIFSYFLATFFRFSNDKALKHRTITLIINRGRANNKSTLIWETMILCELEDFPSRREERRQSWKRRTKFCDKDRTATHVCEPANFRHRGATMFFRCRAALSGRKLKLREQTRAHTAEAALEINIESSFVEIAEDADSINRNAKIQTRRRLAHK